MHAAWMRTAGAVGLLAVGGVCVGLARPDWDWAGGELAAAVGLALVVLLTPALRGAAITAMDRLRGLSRRRQVVGALVVSGVAFGVIYLLNGVNHVPWQLLWHDEHQFHIQSVLLARGRLWMPPHPLVDFFDTFYVLITPVYAPQSFPGAALMFVPSVWLKLPTWVLPLVVAALTAGLLWWVIAQILDPAAATVSVVTLLGCAGYRRLAVMYLAQVPALLLGLVAVAAWLEYRRSGRIAWVAVIGAALGWGLITRPLDAACYGLIVGVATIAIWTGKRLPHVLAAAGLGLAAALPFVALQLVFNHGVTGQWTKAPFTFYNERDQPALAYGSAGDLSRRPVSNVPQKQSFYDDFTLGFIREAGDRSGVFRHVRERINRIAPMLAPGLWAMPLAFVGLLGLRTWRRAMVFAILPLYVVAYARYPIYLFHYVAFALPGLMILYGLAPGVAARCAGARYGRAAEVGVAALLLGFGVGNVFLKLPGPNMYDAYDIEEHVIRRGLAAVRPPAVVLFKPHPNMNVHVEPVYNDFVAWPDDASVVRAHNRDWDDTLLFEYYAQRQPDRTVYLYDRGTNKLTELGNVAALARRFPVTRPATQPAATRAATGG